MSLKPCLLGFALLLPACITPAKQGDSTSATASTDASTDASDSASTDASDSASGDPNATEPGTGTTGSESGSTTGPTTDPVTSTTAGSTTGPGATCDDGEQGQDESDVDCGGGCRPCEGGAACNTGDDCTSGRCDASVCFPLVRSCLELHMQMPELASGAYPLDPDGDGEDPLVFECEMSEPSPGWTRVFIETLAGEPDPAWSPIVEGECGNLGAMLGPHGMGESLTLDISARQVPHTAVKLVVDFVIMDSWDPITDELKILLDGAEIFTKPCEEGVMIICGQTENICGDAGLTDALLPIATDPADHEADPIALEFTSTLDEPIANESWGLAKLSVFVR